MVKVLDLRKRLLNSGGFATRALGAFVRFLPAVIKYGKSYAETTRLIRKYESNEFDVGNYVKSKLDNVYSQFNTTKYASYNSIHLNHGDPVSSAPLMMVSDLPSEPRDLCPEGQETLELCSTSGSTGTPKVFYLGHDRGPLETAFVHHAWMQAGFTHTQARAVLRGLDGNADSELFKWNGLLQELQISPFLLTELNSQLVFQEISRRKIRFIHGYPSSIEVLARAISNFDLNHSYAQEIRGLLLISEQIYEHQTELFEKVFPSAKQVSFYGQSEKVAFAFQDSSDPDVYHFSPLYGFVELLNDLGERLETKGLRGKLHATGLIFKGSRFVRYELGDTAELVELPSEENRFVLSVRNIQSWRASAPIIGNSGEKFSLAAINMHVRELLDVSRMQLIQRQPGELELYLVTRDDENRTSVETLSEKLQAKLGDSIRVTTFHVKDISLNSRGKAKLFISFLENNG